VLEYCRGGDLDQLLKRHGALPERDARAIIIQVLSALRYMNGYTSPYTAAGGNGGDGAAAAAASPPTMSAAGGGAGGSVGSFGSSAGGALAVSGATAGSSSSSTASPSDASSLCSMGPPPPKRKVIHYDLKPANILFDELRSVKVTDFGLSKIVEDDGSGGGDPTSLDLTSQGAGTYWYLPPECFAMGPAPPRISNKVDVWSVGVILFQMLYGRRPFGEGMNQEQFLLQNAIAQTQAGPAFPPKPSVSAEAKAFIRRCLTYLQADRPDVLAVCEDPYLRMKLKA
jgi:serine/threonine protein kinase